jgi:hypothetical protein
MSLDTQQTNAGADVRTMEGWLPLLNAANQRYGWQLDQPALYALAIVALPHLSRATSTLQAYAILWSVYCRLYPEQ